MPNYTTLTDVARESEEREAKNMAESHNLKYVDLRYANYNPDLADLLPYELCEQTLTLPFVKQGKKVSVATHDSSHADEIIKNLKEQKLKPELFWASRSGVIEALQKLKEASNLIIKEELQTYVDGGSVKIDINNLSELQKQLEGLPSKQILITILTSATQLKASDIHIEPQKENGLLRFRIDGIMHKVLSFTDDQLEEVTKQLKYQSKMKLNRNDIPQDGRFEFYTNTKNEKKLVNTRVSVMPSIHGESIVIRLLDQGTAMLRLADLGMQPTIDQFTTRAINATKGLILVTGPTGSGKTTTLYAILNTLNDGKRKIITLEDPVEYRISGIVQSEISEKHGYNFADGLRSILRHDPDIILVGEIRDQETAKIAVQACLTGHLVLSTLHTNTPASTITRLLNLGVEAYNVTPALNYILAQRLVRKICPSCSAWRDLNSSEKEFTKKYELSISSTREPAGCEKCNGTGYKGRIGIFAPLPITETLKTAILANETEVQIEARIKIAGLPTLTSSGAELVKNGKTTMTELLRVIGF